MGAPTFVSCGSVAAALLASLLLAAAPVRAATVTVTGTGDTIAVDGLVTLREAITSINNGSNVNTDVVASGSYGSADTIAFNIPFTTIGDGVHTIEILSALPALTRTVTIDGETQTLAVGDTNPGTLGTGGTVGTTALALVALNRPEIEIHGTSAIASGLSVGANGTVIRNLAVYGFGTYNIEIQQNGNNIVIENNVVGTPATSFTDPGAAARSAGVNVGVSGGGTNNDIIRNNLIGFANGAGVDLHLAGGNFQVVGNEIRGNGITSATADGVDLTGQSNVNTIVSGNLIVDNGGFGIDMFTSNGNARIEQNTISGNGIGGVQTAGIGLGRTNNNRVTQNILSQNAGAAILVGSDSSGNPFSRNSSFGNGTIGIDLLAAADDQDRGTAPYVTINDLNDADNGGNGLLNFPVITDATINSGVLQVSGFARPSSVIELFVADPTASGFGQGHTYLTTLTEQSEADLDGTMGTYGPDPINGLSQGTDTTNRFRFLISLASLPATVTGGTVLTATATLANATSEFSGNVVVTGDTTTITLSGTVFEDVNYGGGPGRSLADSGGVGRPGAIVELYNGAGDLVASTTTDAAGLYTFTGYPVDATYFTRVVNGSVSSSRPGAIGGLLAVQTVQTYRTDVASRRTVPVVSIGGAVPAAEDSGQKVPGGNLGDAEVEQTVTPLLFSGGLTRIAGVDFGFNFSTIVNTNDAGQGSLRQFIINANALLNAGLDQADTIALIPAGIEASIFAIPGSGTQTITLASALPALADDATWIDGYLQPGASDSTVTVGDNAVRLIALNGAAAGGTASGLVLANVSACMVRGLQIDRFADAAVAVIAGPNNVIQSNVLSNNARGIAIGGAVTDTTAIGNTIHRNSILGNSTLGIDLGVDGVTINDSGDVDVGPNNLLNFPVLTRAVALASIVEIEGFARPGSIIELFAAQPHATGFGEGRLYLATVTEGASNDLDARTGSYGPVVNGVTVGSDTTNRFRFRLSLSASMRAAIPEGTPLTATATLNGSTSEFSAFQAIEYPADMSISISAPAIVQPGAALTYTVIVTNNGSGTATGVSVNVIVPAGLTFQSNAGACVTAFPCTFATMAAGTSHMFTATFTVATAFEEPNPIVGTATVASISIDPNLTNNTATASTALPDADLSITKTELRARTSGTDPLIFEIRVRNLGPHAAVGVRVDDATPSGITFVENTGACTTPFPCDLGTLSAGETRIIRASYAVPFGVTTQVVNTATVSSATPDANLTNNTATASSPRQSDLSVTMTGPATVTPGDSITYTIVVTNGGPNGVSEVTVAHSTPEGLTFVSTTGACETAFPCTIGPLGTGEQAIILATYLVSASAASATSIVNTVTISSAIPDPDSTNNTATFTSAVSTTAPDTDGDGMSDAWESCFGVDPARDDRNEDPDGDGRTNAQEFADRTHPRGVALHHLPEGADNAFFAARFAVTNPNLEGTAHVLMRMQPEGAPEIQACFPLPPGDSTLIVPSVPTALRVGGSLGLSFATLFESDLPLVAERTMTWVGGGEHIDTALDAPADVWYFAEGATHGGFRAYYQLQNPGPDPSTVEMTFLRPFSLGPVVKTYALEPRSRLSIFANDIPELLGIDVAAIARVTSGGQIAAARSMYRDVGNVLLRAGTSASGASSAATQWYFAEGATSSFFAEYLLVINPDPSAATLDLTFVQGAGAAPITHQITVPASSRLTLGINDLDPALAGTSSALRVTSTNDVPVVVERSMWWSNTDAATFWTEGHLSTGATMTAPRWRFASQSLDAGSDMFLLVANHGGSSGRALITLTYADGSSSSREVDLPAQARTTLYVNELVSEAIGESFYIEVSSLGGPLPLVVERALYRTANTLWSSGAVTLGVPRP